MKKYLILAVDDDRATLKLYKAMLKDEDIDLITATNGFDAITLYDEKEPDLIITDIEMPHLDGCKLVTHLRGIGFEKPIIISSSDSSEHKDFLKKRIVLFMTKSLILMKCWK